MPGLLVPGIHATICYAVQRQRVKPNAFAVWRFGCPRWARSPNRLQQQHSIPPFFGSHKATLLYLTRHTPLPGAMVPNDIRPTPPPLLQPVPHRYIDSNVMLLPCLLTPTDETEASRPRRLAFRLEAQRAPGRSRQRRATWRRASQSMDASSPAAADTNTNTHTSRNANTNLEMQTPRPKTAYAAGN